MPSKPELRHTASPWTYRASSSGTPVYVEGPHAGGVAWLIAQVAGRDENMANARLISAAPELLDALREFMDIWGSGDSNNPSKRAQGRRARMWEKADAAIAKATGGTPSSTEEASNTTPKKGPHAK